MLRENSFVKSEFLHFAVVLISGFHDEPMKSISFVDFPCIWCQEDFDYIAAGRLEATACMSSNYIVACFVVLGQFLWYRARSFVWVNVLKMTCSVGPVCVWGCT